MSLKSLLTLKGAVKYRPSRSQRYEYEVSELKIEMQL